jgi:hypothetical protein
VAIASRLSYSGQDFTATTNATTATTTTATGPVVGDVVYWFGVCDAANRVPTPPAGYTVVASNATGPSISVGYFTVTTSGAQTITATKPAGAQSSVFVIGYVLTGSNASPDMVAFNYPGGVSSANLTAPGVIPNGGTTSWSLSVLASGAGGGLVNSGTNITPNPTGSIAATVVNNANATVGRWTLAANGDTGTRVTTSAAASLWGTASIAVSQAGTAQFGQPGPPQILTAAAVNRAAYI